MLNTLFTSVGHASPISYIDGGTGSMLVQAGIAAVLSGLYIAKTRFAQLKAVIASRTSHKHADQ